MFLTVILIVYVYFISVLYQHLLQTGVIGYTGVAHCAGLSGLSAGRKPAPKVRGMTGIYWRPTFIQDLAFIRTQTSQPPPFIRGRHLSETAFIRSFTVCTYLLPNNKR